MKCIRITSDGSVIVDIEEQPPEEPTALTEWLVGAACFINLGGCVAIDLFVPCLMPLAGAVSSASIEAFIQVVIENRDIKNVQWTKVAISAISGALISWACPSLANGVVNGLKPFGKALIEKGSEKAAEFLLKLAGYAVQAFSTSLVAGATGAAYSYVDGGSADDMKNAFISGAAIAGALSVLTSLTGELTTKAMKALEKSKPDSWLVKTINKGNSFISDHQVHLKNEKLEDFLAPKSIQYTTQSVMNDIKLSLCNDQVIVDRITQLPKDNNTNFKLVDEKGVKIKKSELYSKRGNCYIELADDCDDIIRQEWVDKNVTRIKVTEGVPDLSDFAEYSFSTNITPNREENYIEFYTILADKCNKGDEDIPKSILELLDTPQFSELKGNITSTDAQNIIQALNLTPHEGVDGKVYFVNSYLHVKLGHSGGVATAKAFAELKLGTVYFSNLSSSTPKGISGTLIAEAVTN